MFPVAALSLVLYTRLDAADLLGHEHRRALLEHVAHHPGLTISELAMLLDVHFKTVEHHARHLARSGLLVVAAHGRRRACYLPGGPREAPVPTRALVALRAVAGGAASSAMLARALHVPRGTAGSLLARLEAAGLVAREEGRWRLTPRARAALSPTGGCA